MATTASSHLDAAHRLVVTVYDHDHERVADRHTLDVVYDHSNCHCPHCCTRHLSLTFNNPTAAISALNACRGARQ